MKKAIAVILLVIIISVFFVFPTSAEGYIENPYVSYNYNEWDNAVVAPSGFTPNAYIYGDEDLYSKLSAPIDMFIDNEGNFYVLNSEEKSVIILDSELKLKKNLSVFYNSDGTKKTLIAPTGIYYKDGLLYICDSEQSTVFVTDIDGNIKFTIGKPESDVYPQDKVFNPLKVSVDKLGYIYVIAEGIYYGALSFTPSGEFFDFYGSNTVDVTAEVLLDRFWRNFMTEQQIDNTANFVPVEYTNFDVDSDGFIYTCTSTSETDQIKKLNSAGGNNLKSKVYGDIAYNWVKGTSMATSFIDIAVDENGFIYALDETRGRIFVYDTEGNEIFIFGGKGSKIGSFITPSAIEVFNGKIYVLDSTNDSITEFCMNEYGEKIYNATLINMRGKYDEAAEQWNEVLKMNENYLPAYVGIGKAYYYKGEYFKAIKYFKLGSDRELESRTFAVLRKALIREWAATIIIIIVLFIVGIFIVKYNLRKRRKRNG